MLTPGMQCICCSRQPFDSLMDRVHDTLADLDSAVGDVERGLELLDSGLGSVEQDVDNGRLQLYSTGKVSVVWSGVGGAYQTLSIYGLNLDGVRRPYTTGSISICKQGRFAELAPSGRGLTRASAN